MRQAGQAKRKIWSVTVDDIDSYTSQATAKTDYLAIEEPLEIRLKANEEVRTIAITMRTPGDDYNLTAGFLLSEGIICHRHDFSDFFDDQASDWCGHDDALRGREMAVE